MHVEGYTSAGRYKPEYWVHMEIAGARTLYDLDAFLR